MRIGEIRKVHDEWVITGSRYTDMRIGERYVKFMMNG